MRVLLAASKYLPEYTGAALRLHRLYAALCRQNPGWTVRVVCAGIEYETRADYEHEGVPVHRLRSRAPRATGRAGRLWRESLDAAEALRYLRRIPCDLVHTVGSGPVVAAAVHAARARATPLLVEMVTAGAVPDPPLPLLGRFHRPDLHRGAAVVAISAPLAEAGRARGYERNVWHRPNPVDTERFYPDPQGRAALRAEVTPFAAGDAVIATVAKFMPPKNQMFLLDVLARLPSRFKLVLAGPRVTSGALAARDGAYLDALRARVRELGLGARVHVVPEFVQAELYIRCADVYAAPSAEEGLGTPVLEAQACAVPVVANAAVAAARPHVTEGVTGFLRPLDPAQWAQAVEAAAGLARDGFLLRAEEIARHHSFTATCDAYHRLLTALRDAGPAAALDVDAVLGSAAAPGPRLARA